MIAKENKISLLFLIAGVVISISLIIYGMLAMRSILVAVSFSILLALLLYPFFRWLDKWNLGRIWAIIISLLVATALVGGLITFISMEIGNFIRHLLQG